MDTNTNVQPKKRSTMQTLALVFMILGTVGIGWMLVPLAWCIPMTVSYAKKTKNGEHVGVGFKVASLILVSMLGGIFMLVAKD